MNKPTFEVDKKGLAKLLERRGKAFILFELLQNAWDENTTYVEATIEWLGDRYVRVTVVDDNPEGFADLSHAYTLFAESTKKSDPEKRGRFNLGEKLVIAVSKSARITTTKGTVEFDKDGRTHRTRKRDSGTEFVGVFQMSKAEYDEVLRSVRTVLRPWPIKTVINNQLLPLRTSIASCNETLPTEVADDEGYLRPTRRLTTVRLYTPAPGETPMLYEMGIPVVETELPWHVDVGQKVPLNADRDNVTPGYMRLINVLVANRMASTMDAETASADWVTTALAHPAVENDTVQHVLTARFGEKRVVYDPSDPEGTKMAVAQGYTVIPSRTFSSPAWGHIRRSGAALPAGRVTPSPKAYSDSPDAKPLETLGPDRWTQDMATFADLAVDVVARAVLHHKVDVRFVSDITWPFAATYGTSRTLTVNIGRLGHAWFKETNKQAHIELLLHEFAHGRVSDHLSREFAGEIARLGARLALSGIMACYHCEDPESH